MPSPRRPILLVGSVPLPDADAVFTLAGKVLGDRIASVPDGETGTRSNWIAWQREVMLAAPFLKELPPEAENPGRRLQFALRRELTADDKFGSLGYAAAAQASYEAFKHARTAGELGPAVRFQVSLPTPAAPLAGFIQPSDITALAPLYARAMREEADAICAAVAADDLSVQWDVAMEVAALEGLQGPPPPLQSIADGLAELASWIPKGVRLGYHFCYGAAGHKHFKEPDSTELLVSLANALFAVSRRQIDYIHMPVPRSRTDDAYFSPLSRLRLPADCTLYLGLVHRTDGLTGAQQRLETAKRFVSEFGVATECGWGRRPPETIPDVMQLTATVADL